MILIIVILVIVIRGEKLGGEVGGEKLEGEKGKSGREGGEKSLERDEEVDLLCVSRNIFNPHHLDSFSTFQGPMMLPTNQHAPSSPYPLLTSQILLDYPHRIPPLLLKSYLLDYPRRIPLPLITSQILSRGLDWLSFFSLSRFSLSFPSMLASLYFFFSFS